MGAVNASPPLSSAELPQCAVGFDDLIFPLFAIERLMDRGAWSAANVFERELLFGQPIDKPHGRSRCLTTSSLLT